MLSSLAAQAESMLARRFFLNAFLPALAFIALLGAVVADGHWGAHGALAHWDHATSSAKWIVIAGYLGAAMVSAVLIGASTAGLVRCYEGRWPSVAGRWPARLAASWHLRRLEGLAAVAVSDPAAYHRIATGYPLPTAPEDVMPTALGNVFKNMETYPRDRYGIDAVLVWPRLLPLIPDQARAGLSDARADLELTVVFSALAETFAVASGTYLVAVHRSWQLFLLCFWGASVLALLAGRAAVSAAMSYGVQVKVVFDLYRHTLLEHLGRSVGGTPAEEQQQWRELAAFWYRGIAAEVEDPAAVPVVKARLAFLPASGWIAVGTVVAGLVCAGVLASTARW